MILLDLETYLLVQFILLIGSLFSLLYPQERGGGGYCVPMEGSPSYLSLQDPVVANLHLQWCLIHLYINGIICAQMSA